MGLDITMGQRGHLNAVASAGAGGGLSCVSNGLHFQSRSLGVGSGCRSGRQAGAAPFLRFRRLAVVVHSHPAVVPDCSGFVTQAGEPERSRRFPEPVEQRILAIGDRGRLRDLHGLGALTGISGAPCGETAVVGGQVERQARTPKDVSDKCRCASSPKRINNDRCAGHRVRLWASAGIASDRSSPDGTDITPRRLKPARYGLRTVSRPALRVVRGRTDRTSPFPAPSITFS
jgi:hypothetical protein